MGNIQNYCCKDTPDDVAEDEREEQSHIWTESGSNQQYGACLPPKTPIVYKIVLPQSIPVEIEPLTIQQHPASPQLNENDSLSLNSPARPNSNPVTPLSDAEGGDFSESDAMLSMETSDRPPSDASTAIKKNKSNSKKRKQVSTQPTVIKEEYCAEQFDHLRSLMLSNPDGQRQFKELLWSCIPWSAPGGKSGSLFLKTLNDQFILKEMSKLELQSFLSISDEYFKYIQNSHNDNKPSLLSTLFGIYRIVYTNSATNSTTEYYFMVMRNLFYGRNITQRFDLKGSVRNRLVDTDDPDNTEHVLMDENLLKIACDHPLFIHAKSKRILNECIDNDSRFLTSISVMDYSLLVGVDKENEELILGIIDYVRPFTWDKKIERVVKSVVSLELPTIVEPELYRERFCEAMDKYFESVPDDDDC